MTITEHQVLALLEPAFLNTEDSQWIGREQDLLSIANTFTCLDAVALAEVASVNDSIPRWYSDGRVSLVIRALNDARRHADGSRLVQDGSKGAGKSAIAQLRQAFDEGVAAGPGGRANTVELVTDGIVKTVADMLFIDTSNVNSSKSVADHGLDSLIAAELRNWFHQALRVNLRIQDLLDANVSIRTLAENIVDKSIA